MTMQFAPYRLPDGRVVMVDASAAKDARIIDFTLANGQITRAVLLDSPFCETCHDAGVVAAAWGGKMACDKCPEIKRQ